MATFPSWRSPLCKCPWTNIDCLSIWLKLYILLQYFACKADNSTSDEAQQVETCTRDLYHGFIIDAGSSGSRIHAYSWTPSACNFSEPLSLIVPTPLGVRSVDGGVTSLDSLNASLQELQKYAEELLADKRADWHRFPVYLLATAGLRRQTPEHRDNVISALQEKLSEWPFYFRPEFVKILSGEEEGAYGWLALNAELGTLERVEDDSVGVLDLGGASLQVTFMPKKNHQVLQNAFPMMLNGQQSNLYATSYLQFGVNEAQRLLHRHLIAHALVAETTAELRHPCLPHGIIYDDALIGEEGNSTIPLRAVWSGHGSYETCAASIQNLFDKQASCYSPPCTFNGRYQPRLGSRRFIAFSTFARVVRDLALKPKETTLEDIENAARYVCKMEWQTLQERWRDLEEQTLRMLCFSATYVVVLLHFGLGFDKQRLQIEYHTAGSWGSFSWAYGAMIWASNHWFNEFQPRCIQAAG